MSFALRLPGWPARLQDFVQAERGRAFRWGSADCCLLAADAVQALTGRDPAAPWRGSYTDEAGARALLEEHGGLRGLISTALGPATNLPAMAGRGDVGAALLPGMGGEEIACVVTAQGLLVRPERGLALVPRSLLRAAWIVG